MRKTKADPAFAKAAAGRPSSRRLGVRDDKRIAGVTARFTIAALVALAMLPAGVAAQAQAPAPATAQAAPKPLPKPGKIPRMADGHPSLEGVWQGGSNRVGTWEETNTGSGPLGESGPITPYAIMERQPAPPYQPWVREKMLQSYNMRGVDEPMVRCLPPGVTRTTLMGLFPMQIIQTPKTVVFLFEVFHLFRIIPMDAQHPDDLEPSYMGDSVGHWEGDTLVVDVTGFNDKTWLSGLGSVHSEKLHVIEKFTRVDENTILYESTATDPETLTGPWTRRATIMLRPGTRIREYVCEENNQDIDRYQEMLKNPALFMRNPPAPAPAQATPPTAPPATAPAPTTKP